MESRKEGICLNQVDSLLIIDLSRNKSVLQNGIMDKRRTTAGSFYHRAQFQSKRNRLSDACSSEIDFYVTRVGFESAAVRMPDHLRTN